MHRLPPPLPLLLLQVLWLWVALPSWPSGLRPARAGPGLWHRAGLLRVRSTGWRKGLRDRSVQQVVNVNSNWGAHAAAGVLVAAWFSGRAAWLCSLAVCASVGVLESIQRSDCVVLPLLCRPCRLGHDGCTAGICQQAQRSMAAAPGLRTTEHEVGRSINQSISVASVAV